jgi:hypothetical protein
MDRYQSVPVRGSPAKIPHIFRIVCKILRKTFQGASQVLGKVETGDVLTGRRGTECFLETFPNKRGFRHASTTSLVCEMGEEVIRQFQRNGSHALRVMRYVTLRNTRSGLRRL